MSIGDVGRLRLGCALAAHEALDGLLEHAQIQVEADGVHVAGLLGAEEVPRPAHLHVLERDLVARAELGVVLEHLQAALGVGIDGVGDEEIAVGAAVRAPDAPAQLIELREAEVIGAIDEHRVRVRHVEAALDDERGDEDVHLAADEAVHDVLELALAHLTVRDGDARARHDATDAIGVCDDRLDAVVDEEHLAAAIELARDPLVDQAVVVARLDEGQHGRSVARRRLHERHVAQAGERQVQRARDGRRREREHVGLELELLEPLLVLHTEAMLLVHDDEPEVGEVRRRD